MANSLHFVNAFLCEQERLGIVGDEERSHHDILHALEHVQEIVGKDQYIPNKVIGRVTKLIKVHHTLKYNFTVSFELYPVRFVHNLFTSSHL